MLVSKEYGKCLVWIIPVSALQISNNNFPYSILNIIIYWSNIIKYLVNLYNSTCLRKYLCNINLIFIYRLHVLKEIEKSSSKSILWRLIFSLSHNQRTVYKLHRDATLQKVHDLKFSSNLLQVLHNILLMGKWSLCLVFFNDRIFSRWDS